MVRALIPSSTAASPISGGLYAEVVSLPRTSWRRRPLLALIILILLLVIGYAAREAKGDRHPSSPPAGSARYLPSSARYRPGPAQPAQDGGRLAANAAIPSCACGLAK